VEKLIILSVVLVSMAAPTWFAASAKPRKALRQVQVIVLVFVVVWGYMCTHWYPTLVEIK
jgi:hypothetical protein